MFDPVWARINEAGISVGSTEATVACASISTAGSHGGHAGVRLIAFSMVVTHERQIGDTFAALICHGLFARHPNLRLASIENGGSFVPHLLHELEIAFGKMPQAFAENPVETFQKHVWVSPVLRGRHPAHRRVHRHRPHPVRFGLAARRGPGRPLGFIHDVPFLDDTQLQDVMRHNARALVTPRSALAA